MKAIVLDCETKVSRYSENRHDIDGSVFNPNNRIVSVHWVLVDVDSGISDPVRHAVYFHNDMERHDTPDALRHDLALADIFVAHNAKYDIEYLLESGFTIPEKVWCTMIGEYILSRGVRTPLSLKDTAIRRKVSLKKDDLVSELFYNGTGYEAMPLPIVLEYGDADAQSCLEIFLQQYAEFQDSEKNRNLSQIVTLMNEMLMFLVDIERNGVAIDLDSLEEVRIDYENEREKITHDLQRIVIDVMGDTPINLNSGADMTKVVYSREITNRALHKKTFNIGIDPFTGQEQYPPYMTNHQFATAVRTTTAKVERKSAFNCPNCNGNKFIRKVKKDGSPFKNESKCSTCEGLGFVLIGTGKVAGLKLSPEGPRDASINGFKCGSDELDRLIAQATDKDNLQAVEFLTKKKRLNVINTYLNSFVIGIKRWTREDGLLHPSFNQTVARTGRLSSSDPKLGSINHVNSVETLLIG